MEFVKGNPNINARLEIPVYNVNYVSSARLSLPPNGEFDDMAICKNNGIYQYREKTDGVLVACFDDNGLWYSETNGETWKQSNETTGSFCVFRGPDKWIAVSCSSSSTAKGIRYSLDGKTWTSCYSSYYVEQMNPVAYGNGRYIICVAQGVLTSTDGITWNTLSPLAMGQGATVYANGVFIHCSMSDNPSRKGLWRSTDGTNWTRILSDKKYYNADFANGVWLAYSFQEAEGKMIIRSTDNGQIWSVTDSPNADTSRYMRESIFIGNNTWISIFGSGYQGIYKSIDNGATWTRKRNNGNFSSICYHNGLILCGGSWNSGSDTYGILYSTDLGENFTKVNSIPNSIVRNIVWAGTQYIATNADGYGVYKSKNGKDWSQTYKTTGSGVISGVQFNPNNIIVIGTQSGPKYSEDGGMTWKDSNITKPFIVYRGPDKWVGISLDDSLGIKYSLDGKTWNNTNSGASNGYSITYGNGKYVARFSNGAASSYDGITWTYNAFAPVNKIIFVKDTFYACDREDNANKGVWKSTDGITWTHIYSAKKIQALAYGGGIILGFAFTETEGKCIIRSADNGATWTEVGPTAAEARYFGYAFYKDGVWLAAISSSYLGIYRSTDNGLTWSQAKNSGNYTSNFCYHNGRLLIAGRFSNGTDNQNGILYSDNLGATWNVANTTSEFRGIIWAGDKYIAGSVGSGCHISYDGVYWYNPNGSTFTLVSYPSNNMFYQDGYWEKLIGLFGDSNGIVGEIKPSINTIQDNRWLLCDGSTYDTTKYSELYAILGTNKLPDFRELIPVGAGTNAGAVSTQGSATTFPTGHDVFTKGQIKERQIQNHSHAITIYNHTHTFGLSSSNPNWAHEHTYYHTKSQAQGHSSKDGNDITRIQNVEVNYNTNTAGYWDNEDDDIVTGPNWTNGSPKTTSDSSGNVFAVVSYGVNFYIRASSQYKA